MSVCLCEAAQPSREPAHDRERNLRVVRDDRFEVPGREGQTHRRLVGDDLGDPRTPVEHRQLPEEVTGAETRDRRSVADDTNGAASHQEETRPDLTLAGDDVVLGELDLDDTPRDRVEPGGVHAGKQRSTGQQLRSVVGGDGRAGLHPCVMLRCAVVERQGRRDDTRAERAGRARGTMRVMIDRDELIDAISGFGLFSDLSAPQLEAIIHIFDERMFADGETIVHQGLSGSGFFVIVDGEARVEANGRELARLQRGDFFGEVAILIGVPAIADVIATRQMRCLVLPGPQLESFLISHPKVMYRMLQSQTRRLRAANRTGT